MTQYFGVPEDSGGGEQAEWISTPGTYLCVVRSWSKPKQQKDRWWVKAILEEVPPVVEGEEPKRGRLVSWGFLWDPAIPNFAHGKDSMGMGAKRLREFLATIGVPLSPQGGFDTDATIGRPCVAILEQNNGKVFTKAIGATTSEQMMDAMDYVKTMWHEQG